MLLLAVLGARKASTYPWYTNPIYEDGSMRALCRGWQCGVSKDNITLTEEIADIYSQYRNGTLKNSLYRSLKSLSNKGFAPAKCAMGLSFLFGVDGFPKNSTASLKYAKEGADMNFWACHEILAFHPDSENKTYHLAKAAELGSIYSMLKIIKISPNEKSIPSLRHLVTSASGSWFRRNRSGTKYAQAIQNLLTDNQSKKNQALDDLIQLSFKGHVPSILWITDYYLNGYPISITEDELYLILLRAANSGPWRFENYDSILSSKNLNKTAFIEYYANAGDSLLQTLSSYTNL